jgi:hypothetical protein
MDTPGKRVGVAITTAWAQAFMRDVVAAVRARDWEKYATLHTADVAYSSPIAETKGIADLIEREKAFVAAIPDWSLRVVSMAVDPRAGVAAYESISRGSHSGPPVAPSGTQQPVGEPFEVLAAHFVEFDELGRAKAIRAYFKRGPNG